MNSRLFFWILRLAQYAAVSLLAAMMLSSCAPVVSTPSATLTVVPATSTVVPADTLIPANVTAPVPTQTAEVQAIATSRGPNLEATDPTTVSLASGQLQLVEFFRFT